MLPRPNRNKIQKIIGLKGGRELLTAEVFGYQDKNSMDNPGGGGGYNAFFTRDSQWLLQQEREREMRDIRNIENKLARIREAIRVRNIGSKSQERTNSNK